MRRHYAYLIALTVLALLLRTWHLSRVPPGFTADEASFGYNAYSILRTGKDEYGERLPLLFRAFGEYKRPAYVYALVPSIAILGETVTAVRLPAALAGTASVPAMYAVTVLLLRDPRLGLCAAGMLALSPWGLQFSRGGWELSFLLLGALLLVGGLLASCRAAPGRAGPFLCLAVFGLILALYSQTAGILVAPLLATSTIVVYRRRLARVPAARLALFAAVTVVCCLPLAQAWADGRLRVRQDQVSLFTASGVAALSTTRIARDEQDGTAWAIPLQLRWVVALREALASYLAHFDFSFLFTRGDQEWRHHSSDNGQIYLWDLPLLVVGLGRLARHWRRPAFQLAGIWLAIGPLPAAFARDAPHAGRSLLMLPALYLVEAVAIWPLWRWLRARRLAAVWIVLFATSAAYYLFAYHEYYPVEHDFAWSDGALAGLREAKALVDAGKYRRVVLPGEVRGGLYIFALFATGYDPAAYLAHGGTRLTPEWPLYPDVGPLSFPPFEVRDVDWEREPRRGEVLYVWHGGLGLPAGGHLVAIIRSRSNQQAMQLFDLRAD